MLVTFGRWCFKIALAAYDTPGVKAQRRLQQPSPQPRQLRATAGVTVPSLIHNSGGYGSALVELVPSGITRPWEFRRQRRR